MIRPVPKPHVKRLEGKALKLLHEAVYKRDHGRCKCGKWIEPGTPAHHIILKSQGGEDPMSNLEMKCTDCHDNEHNAKGEKMLYHLIKLAKEFNQLKSDESRYCFLLEHKGIFALRLDNDATYTTFSSGTFSNFPGNQIDSLPDLADFDHWLGSDAGVFILLDIIGIEADGA